jgi:7,8-dihydropterin-6-yl-methyl-4-(beta-D-ribofuranosyl)aminobenzene 5'-phosphate synthase
MPRETKIKTEAKLEGVSITTLYDNYQANPKLKTGWGFSCLIKTENQDILFDTGADSPTLLSNMEKLKIDIKEIDFIVISHLHGDHIGGLPGILEIEPNLKVYKPEFFSGPTQVVNRVWTTGPLGTWTKEQSLILNTNKGLVIITGCAHPGIVNIIKKVKEMFPKENIYLVLGGFHLLGASDSELKNIINDFRELGVQKAAPSHCSGDRCRELFQEEYNKDFINNGVGKIIEI